MKRSSHVAAPLLASAAVALLSGCKPAQMQRCVDEHGVVVDESFCENQPQVNPYGGSYPRPYRWYYGGGGSYFPGSVATGGGYVPSGGTTYSTARGGFGGTHGGGGEGGGE
jgi:hypothetical protein